MYLAPVIGLMSKQQMLRSDNSQICTARAVPVYPLRAEYFVENINVYLFFF